MKALLYLLTRSVRNYLHEILRRPARLLMYVFVLVLIAIGLIANMLAPPPPTGYKDIRFLGIMFFTMLLMVLGPGLGRAFKSGGSLFQMSDVNLLFTAPIAPQKILLYGIIQFLKVAVVSGAFILFQSTTLGQAFGVGITALLLIVVIFALCFCLAEVMVMLIYSVTNGQPRRQRLAKTIIALIFLPLAVTILMALARGYDWQATLLYVFDSPALQAIPAAGWGAVAVVAIITGNWTSGVLFSVLIALTLLTLLLLLLKMRADYYEDVLVATEAAFALKRSMAEGNIDAVRAAKRNIKVAGTGLWGRGATAIFGKHVREVLRGSRGGFVNLQTVLYVAAAVIYVIAGPRTPFSPVLTILPLMTWMQIFVGGVTPGWRELHIHYLYLIPAASFSKILWMNMAVVIKSAVDAVLVFGIVGLLARENPLMIMAAVLAYCLFTLVLSGINVVSLRWAATDMSTGIMIAIYMLAVLVVMMPGVLPAIIAGSLIAGTKGYLIALAIVCFWEIVVSCLCFALSRGILARCDMPATKMSQ